MDTWYTGRERGGKSCLGYAFYAPGDTVPLFLGEDFYSSPMHSIDGDETLHALVGFLTLRPGDTDADYFDCYTWRQLEFARDGAESLSEWGTSDGDYGDEYEAPEFVDVDAGAS